MLDNFRFFLYIVPGDFFMDEMENFVKKGLLFDFYGPLLTQHQQKIYQAVVLDDYSISEVAEDEGISRQSVHDLIRRCDRQLEEYEEKLGLVERFRQIQQKIRELQDLL